MKKTLYLSDLDGTLLDSSARLGSKTAEALNRLLDGGLLFTCATARSFSSAGPLLSGLRLRLPVATYNGAFLVHPASGHIADSRLPSRGALAPLMAALRQGGWPPLVYALIGGRERVSWLAGAESPGVRRYLQARQGDARLRRTDSYDWLFEGDIFYITLIGEAVQAPALRALARAAPGLYSHLLQDTYAKNEYWLEFYAKDASKAHALKRLKKLAGADEVVCFGDNLNDLPMFAASDRCYAVAGACAEVRAAATGVIGGSNEDGVARYIESEVTGACPAALQYTP